ncbi:MAG: SRPBCC family protein [Caldilineaceae bacterium]
MAQYKFVDHWYINAPREEVFRFIADARTYPQWWPVYPKVEILQAAEPGQIGGKVRLVVQSALGYCLTLEAQTVASEPPAWVKTIATGQLAGTGDWEFIQEGDTTHAIFTWTVESHHWLVNLLEPIAKPLFAWSHNDASRKGHLGLKKLLEKPTLVANG